MKDVKEIAVIYSSDSSEWEISCRSGVFTAASLDHKRFNVYEIFARFGSWQVVAYSVDGVPRVEIPAENRVEVDKTDFSSVVGQKKVKFDYAYIMQHGIPGENGKMQGYLEMLDIPFSSCSAFVSAITFDKFSCKSYLRNVDFVKCAKDIFVRKGEVPAGLAQRAVSELGLPLFVKPTDGGSSFGVTKVKSEGEVDKAVDFAFEDSDTVLIESAISGRELTCAVYFDGKENVALPVIEIVTENEYFDYEAKYNGHSQEICPAPIEPFVAEMIADASEKIYSRLGCSGVVRVDYILADDGLYFLEVNTIPGMTAASLVPKMVKTAGIDMTDFLSTIIDTTCRR